MIFLLVSLVLFMTAAVENRIESREYCVIGAGPAGLQMGYFLEQANRDYVILERNDIAGSFFRKFPRHRGLISINKKYTGKRNKDYNERHDWNSLLTFNHEGTKFGEYSDEMFPNADVLVKYLQDYADRYALKIVYNQNVENIRRMSKASGFEVKVANLTSGNEWFLNCKIMLMANGLTQPLRPIWATGKAQDYSTMSTNKSDFADKYVLIIGSGNAAFETANHMKDTAGAIMIATRTKETPLSYQTHYVGHVRGVNFQFIDLYQLKSLAAIANGYDVNRQDLYLYSETDKKWKFNPKINEIDQKNLAATWRDPSVKDPAPTLPEIAGDLEELQAEYEFDEVITCMGWTLNVSMFHASNIPHISQVPGKNPKHPQVNEIFESVNQPGMFFLGTNAHSYDKDASGGFIHGFRYQIKVLHNILEQKNHQKHWPFVEYPFNYLLLHMVKRINTAAGPYQMFHTLCDVIVKMKPTNQISGYSYRYFEEVPIKLMHRFPEIVGLDFDQDTEVMIWYFDYGPGFSCVGCNTLAPDRAFASKYTPEKSNFIHPVIEQYLLRDLLASNANQKATPVKKFGLTENILAFWMGKTTYVHPLADFLYLTWGVESTVNYDFKCMMAAIEGKSLKETCDPMFKLVEGLGKIETNQNSVRNVTKNGSESFCQGF
ncbi:FAD-dependent oxidoreductase domain-containing protein 2-like [Convolutriloba macropyga]|uniref:FAD-dependent oxidoreductase domain-containing protein 2-like n=1 Tax=Convolutriloba macropyga TaxID=536237 RepID=UPI003F526653